MMNEENLRYAEFSLEYGTQAKALFEGKTTEITDAEARRQIESIMILGTANLTPEKQTRYNNLAGWMQANYSTAMAVMPDGRELPLDPDLTALMATSRDYLELKNAWKGWYEAAGRPIKDSYEEFVALSNEASKADGFNDTGEYWRSWYEEVDLEGVTEQLWIDLKPLYEELHAFVRRKLYDVYGPNYINLKGPIPAHLLGNMWAQQWGNVYDLVEPYPGKAGVDATPGMLDQGYDALKMFEVSEEFFTSLGLLNMTQEFWNFSMITKPADRDVVCHASAWDFYNQKDFRIKMCTVVNMEDLITVHHEMGHIQYFQQYAHQPIPFRGGANPGFHEAVGDTLALSVSTPKHLLEINLLDSVETDTEADINYLMSQAMDKIAFLPFGYMIDKWRWRVFDGATDKANYQSTWDDLRLQYQGIVPPVERDNTLDFDPGAKFHIPANTPYIRYFVSFVIQFQFYEAMCLEAGHQGELYKCDFYNSKEAGAKLAAMLQMGSSKPWPEAMQAIVGSNKMSTASLRRYFQPLTDWLHAQNVANGETVGWPEDTWRPMGFASPDGAPAFLEQYNSTSEVKLFEAVDAEWNYNVNINDQTQAASEAAGIALSNFQAEQAVGAKLFEPSEITDTNLRRQVEKISVVGEGALSDEDLAALSKVNGDMQTAYSTATYNGKPLDPDLTATMASSRNYNELRDTWKGWRDASGKLMREDFKTYVDLQNEVAVLNGFDDMGAFWRAAYETPNIEQQFEAVWQEMLPLYEQLHAFVRRRLYQQYGDKVINLKGPIPAHLLGNMWAQDWLNVYNLVEPYAGYTRPDATAGLQQQGWTAEKMFHEADDFFGNMGLIRAPQAFWDKTMFTKPTDRDVVCHASAWDFYNRQDFRIKMCTEINQQDFVTIHHELGHIQYYLQYMDQPTVFRDGANPGFHEAVGDTLALSVGTLDHLYKLDLIGKPDENPQSDINYLMSVALDKIAFIPFGYLMDKWRWDVFSGRSAKTNLNQAWWDYRVKYQGVTPPLSRTEEDFDPGAKFHIPNNVPYIRYFVSVVVQFQFYEALCGASGHVGDLYKCDFNGSTEAGKMFGDMLKLGSSVTWEDALEKMTGTREMSSASLVKYFQPLLDFLTEQNTKNNEVIGWPDYSWEPPTNTIQNEDGTVSLDNSGNMTKSSSMVLLLVAIQAVLKWAFE
uniref:Angiotensin-converting enzyme n=1 Tax=Phallusia mammillata TaxID=59560 RepID=A0A6F9D6A2_9ASCI|nr:angiotensin-converting enzyme-like [Phallusia mammillata]